MHLDRKLFEGMAANDDKITNFGYTIDMTSVLSGRKDSLFSIDKGNLSLLMSNSYFKSNIP